MLITVSSMRRLLQSVALPAIACGGLLQACASPESHRESSGFQQQLNAGDYAGAAKTAINAGQIAPDGTSKNIVWSLNAGQMLFDAEEPNRSIAIFDNTEELMKADDLNRMQAALDYKYTTYDKIMTNTYKAFVFLKQGNNDSAGIEFRRAEDRQRIAEDESQKEIVASQRRLDQGSSTDLQDVFRKAQQSTAYAGELNSVSQMAAGYATFENPFTTYIAGVFLLAKQGGTASDREDGLNKLRRAAGILGPSATSIQSDIAWANGVVGGRGAGAQTWIVFENGQSPTFHELHLVLPMITGHPMTLAMPMIVENPPASSHLSVEAGGMITTTAPAGSFDAVMASEFRRRMPVILAAAVIEVALKNGVSITAQKSNNAFVGLLSDVAANVSTADTRSWTGLPKEFQAVRVVTPADGRIGLTTAEGVALGGIQVPTDRSCIVYVKLQKTGAKPSLQVIKL